MGTYTAQLRRDGEWWSVWVPEIGHATQGRPLAAADERARDLVCLWIEEDHGTAPGPEETELRLDSRLPSEVHDHVEQADNLRARAQQTQQVAAEERAEAVRTLRRAGVSLPDAGRALGPSHQRVGHLARR